MGTRDNMEEIRKARERWQQRVDESLGNIAGARQQLSTDCGIPIKWTYTPEDVEAVDYLRDLHFPGEYPFTRGVYTTMHRARPWTMRLVSGYGSGRTSNERLKFLLAAGETGLNVVFDMPTHKGCDCDDPRARGEVGCEGTPVSSLQDMEELFEDIPLGKISASLIANATAPVILAMYIALAEKRGTPLSQLEGSIQNDILKEYEVVGTSYVFPPEHGLKMAIDVVEYCTRHLPRWNTVTFNGHCIRENGVNAAQEIALVLANAKVYIKAVMERGLDVDEFAPRLAFFLGAHSNFFEEVAKYRATRRLWARMLREEFQAKSPRSWLMRAAAGCNGSTMTSQQPYNNIVRTAYEALAAVLGGCQSLFTTSYDEALGLPTEEAARISLNTQNILAYETGVTDSIDPLGGSYYVEALTNALEEKILDYVGRIEAEGGVLRAIERGFFEREVTQAAMTRLAQIESGERVVVGYNRFRVDEELSVKTFRVDPHYQKEQRANLVKFKRERNTAEVERALDGVRQAARRGENLMPSIIEAVKGRATLGEVTAVLKELYGEYRPLYATSAV